MYVCVCGGGGGGVVVGVTNYLLFIFKGRYKLFIVDFFLGGRGAMEGGGWGGGG